jgi:hypothetical protein
LAQCAKPRPLQICFDTPPQFVEVAEIRFSELTKRNVGIGHWPLRVGIGIVSLVANRHRSRFDVIKSVPDVVLTDLVINLRGLHVQRAMLVKVFVDRRVEQALSRAVHFYVIAPAREIRGVSGLLGVVRTPPSYVTNHKQVSVAPARGEHIVLAGSMLFLCLITRQRYEENQGAPAPQYASGEADLARLRGRLLHQSGRARDPRLGQKQRFVGRPRSFFLGHFDGKRRRLPGVAELKATRNLALPGSKIGAEGCDVPSQEPLLPGEPILAVAVAAGSSAFDLDELGGMLAPARKNEANSGPKPTRP